MYEPAATIPYRRQISFWAKASSFKNPVLGFILVSSGAIPVHRNPDNMRDASMAGTLRSPANDTLFQATSRALAGLRPRGGLLNRLVGMFPDRVVGVFPEGTSYTEPCIVQVKEGAAWVALEYSRWMRENEGSDGQPIKVIPVGIAYTDKTQYLSRVSVEQLVFPAVINCVIRQVYVQ
jgi:glycerol-3-phosphate O-acyltransferase / dihydroxyacetone phosphate acyltransferase